MVHAGILQAGSPPADIWINEQRQRVVMDLACGAYRPRGGNPPLYVQQTAISGCDAAYRHEFAPAYSEGTCRVYRCSDELYIGATEQRSKIVQRLHIYGDDMVTIRIALAGDIRWKLDRFGTFDLASPMIVLHQQPLDECLTTEHRSGGVQRTVTMLVAPQYLADQFGVSLASTGGHPQFLRPTPQIQRMATELLENPYHGARHGHFVAARALELLCALASAWEDAAGGEEPCDWLTLRDAARIRLVRDVLAESFRKPPGIVDLARSAGMNRGKLMRGFKQMFGETIADHCRRLRLDEARALLATQPLTIGEVAIAVGYEHQSSFTAAFTAHFGMLPKSVQAAPRRRPPSVLRHN